MQQYFDFLAADSLHEAKIFWVFLSDQRDLKL